MKIFENYDMEKAIAMGLYEENNKYCLTKKGTKKQPFITFDMFARERLISKLGDRLVEYGGSLINKGYFKLMMEDPKVKAMMDEWVEINDFIELAPKKEFTISKNAYNYNPKQYLEMFLFFNTAFHSKMNAVAINNLILNYDMNLDNLFTLIIDIMKTEDDKCKMNDMITSAIRAFAWEWKFDPDEMAKIFMPEIDD